MATNQEQSRRSTGVPGRLAVALGVPVAAVLALGGQFVISFRGDRPMLSITTGAGLYALALAVLVVALIGRRTEEPREWTISRGLEWGLVAFIVVAGLYLRLHQIDMIPWGLNNDEAINAIEASAIARGKAFSTITENGLNRETMFHYLAASSLRYPGLVLDRLRAIPAVFGLHRRFADDPMMTVIFPLRLVSILIGTLTILALHLLVRRRFGLRVGLLAALFLAVSPWHILYSRVGLRAILAPLFAIMTVALFLRARDSGRTLDHLFWGLILGAGLWTYTSFRAVLVALPVFVVLDVFLQHRRAPSTRTSGPPLLFGVGLATVVAALMMVLSNLSPADFLFRGAYAALPERASWLMNLLHSLTMLNYYPGPYAVIQSSAFISDGVSTVFGSIGLEPESIIVVALATPGLVFIGWRALTRPRFAPALLILLCWAALLFTVGWTGPSLTRMLMSVPWVCLFAALFAWRVFDDIAALKRPVMLWVAAAALGGIIVLACVQGYSNYFLQAGRKERAMQHFGPTQTIMGMFVRSLPPEQEVYVLHTWRVDSLRYLIGDRPDVHLITDPLTVNVDAIIASPRTVTFVVEHARAFAEPLRYLMTHYPQGDMTQVADLRFDPDTAIFYTFTIWKDAMGQPIPPPGAPPGGVLPAPPGAAPPGG